MDHRTGPLLATSAASFLLVASLAACGGGGGDMPFADPNGTSTTQHLTCTSTCTESDTQPSSALHVEYFVLDDGQRAQAQAGFSTHPVILNYNVELEGDVQDVIHGGTTQRLALPRPGNLPWDFQILTPPYLADLASAKSGTTDFTFQLTRSTGCLLYTSPSPRD